MYLHDGSAVIGNGLSAIGINEQEITTIRAECAFDSSLNCQAGVDVRDDLTFTLRGVRSCTHDEVSTDTSRAH